MQNTGCSVTRHETLQECPFACAAASSCKEVIRSVIKLHLKTVEVAHVDGVCAKIVVRWVRRCTYAGHQGIFERTAYPHQLYRPTSAKTVETIIALQVDL